MAEPERFIGSRPSTRTMAAVTSAETQSSLVRPVYFMGLSQLLIGLSIGVIGMFAASKSCVLSITWVYFFLSLWIILTSSVGLSPSRRALVSYNMEYVTKLVGGPAMSNLTIKAVVLMMNWYRIVSGIGMLMVLSFMALELTGLLDESESESLEGINCITMHLILLAVGFISLLVLAGGIILSTRIINYLKRLPAAQDREDVVSSSEQPNTVSGRFACTNFGMVPDLISLPEYSVDADLPPNYNDVISGKADGIESCSEGNLDHEPTMT